METKQITNFPAYRAVANENTKFQNQLFQGDNMIQLERREREIQARGFKSDGRDFKDVMQDECDKMFGVNMTPNEYMLDWEERHGGWDE